MAKTVYTNVQRIQDFPIDYITDRKKFRIRSTHDYTTFLSKIQKHCGRGRHIFIFVDDAVIIICFLFRQHSFDLTETKLIGVLCSSDLWEGSESESALHLTYVVVQNCGRTESLS